MCLVQVPNVMHKLTQPCGWSQSSWCTDHRWERERAQLVACSTVELVLKLHPVREAKPTCISKYKLQHMIHFCPDTAFLYMSSLTILSSLFCSGHEAERLFGDVKNWFWCVDLLYCQEKKSLPPAFSMSE